MSNRISLLVASHLNAICGDRQVDDCRFSFHARSRQQNGRISCIFRLAFFFGVFRRVCARELMCKYFKLQKPFAENPSFTHNLAPIIWDFCRFDKRSFYLRCDYYCWLQYIVYLFVSRCWPSNKQMTHSKRMRSSKVFPATGKPHTQTLTSIWWKQDILAQWHTPQDF